MRVLCFGNRLHGDDGLGPAVHDALQQRCLPPDVEVIDAGTAGMGALMFFEGCQHVICVDAMESWGQPGAVHALDPQTLVAQADALTVHGQGLDFLLRVLPLSMSPSALPEVSLLGVEVASVAAFREQLSDPVRAAIPEVVEAVLALLKNVAPARACEPDNTERSRSQASA